MAPSPNRGGTMEPWHIIAGLLLAIAAVTTVIVLAVRRK
jgi:hypothetical protein